MSFIFALTYVFILFTIKKYNHLSLIQLALLSSFNVETSTFNHVRLRYCYNVGMTIIDKMACSL